MAGPVPTVDVTCAQCGAVFQVLWKRNWTNYKFCGSACAETAKRAYRPEYLRRFARRPLEAVEVGTKACRVCDQEKPVTAFSRSSNYKDGRQSTCHPCLKAAAAARWATKTDAQKEAIRHDRRAKRRAWKLANPDKVRAATKRASAKNTERFYRWRAANLERSNAHIKASGYKRRAAKKGGLGGAATLAWFKAQKKKCHWCGGPGNEIDHLIALSRGGAHEACNLVIACGPCNRRKSAKDPIAFAQELGRLL